MSEQPPNDDGKFAAEQKRSRTIIVVAVAVLLFVIIAVFVSMRSAIGL